MPGRLLLPKNEIGSPDYEIGKWKDFTRDFPLLNEKIIKPNNIQERVTSIPSPWARLLLFRDALNPEHQLHEKLMSELLDVLEIIFYKHSIIYDLDYKVLDFTNHIQNNFIATLSDLNPNMKFNKIILFYLKQKGD